MHKFSVAVSNYTECISSFARPIEVCLRCREQYLSVSKTYNYMDYFHQYPENVSCRVILTKQDRLGIMNHMYGFATGSKSIWKEASCDSKYNFWHNVLYVHCPALNCKQTTVISAKN